MLISSSLKLSKNKSTVPQIQTPSCEGEQSFSKSAVLLTRLVMYPSHKNHSDTPPPDKSGLNLTPLRLIFLLLDPEPVLAAKYLWLFCFGVVGVLHLGQHFGFTS